MAKKDKPRPGHVTPEVSPLRHNPFAALLGGTPAPAPEKAPDPEPPAREEKRPKERSEPLRPEGKARGRLVLRRETKHRGGKAVVIVTGFSAVRDFDAAAVEALAKLLKQSLGCGGTVEDEGQGAQIVLQGDKPARVAELLRAQGFRVDGVTS